MSRSKKESPEDVARQATMFARVGAACDMVNELLSLDPDSGDVMFDSNAGRVTIRVAVIERLIAMASAGRAS